METKPLKILLIEDQEADAAAIQRLLERAPELSVDLVTRDSATGGLAELFCNGADCVLLDYRLGNVDGLETLSKIRGQGVDSPVVFVTGEGSEDVAVDALRRGAQEYLVKSHLNQERLRRSILNATRSVENERRMRQKQQELEEFVSVVAHDLQQPLCAIKGNVELLRDFYGGQLDRQGREFVESAVRMSTRMSQMIEALLGYARVGRASRRHRPVDFNRAAEAALSSLSELIRARSAVVEVGELPTAMGDEILLTQLLQNLVANAVKFCEDEPRVEITGGLEGSNCLVQVRDHGIGIPADKLEEIFAPFKRLHSHQRFEGSGIGLATCRRIVENHMGRIGVRSEEGAGSTFWFTVPAFQQEATRHARVLIADDEEEIVRLTAAALELHGYETCTATSCRDAAEILSREAVDLMIADVNFPGEDGLAFIRETQRGASPPPILAISGGGATESPGSLLYQARCAGASRVLSKPFDMDKLLRAVRVLIDDAPPPELTPALSDGAGARESGEHLPG